MKKISNLSKLSLITFMIFGNYAWASDARSYNSVPSDISLLESQVSSYHIKQTKANGLKIDLQTEVSYIRALKYFNYQDNLAAAYVLLPYTKNNLSITSPLGSLSNDTKQVGDVKIFLGLGLLNQPALERKEWIERKNSQTLGVQNINKNYDTPLSQYTEIPEKIHEAVDETIAKTIADKNERLFNIDAITCGLTTTLPTSNYDPTATNNIGSNRFALKPECAVSWKKGRWQTEWYTAFTYYTDNNKYQGTKSLKQKNLYGNELHISYNLGDNLWLGADLFHAYGGETSVNDIAQKDKYNNYSYGMIANYKVSKNQNIKISYQKTFKSTDFSPTVNGGALTYQVFW